MAEKAKRASRLWLRWKALEQMKTGKAIRLVETDMVLKLMLLREQRNFVMNME